MRILRLAVDDGHVVDLHPRCSVVTDLGPARSVAVRRAVAAIGVGLAPDLHGIVEAHGVLLSADQSDLDLLALGADPVRAVATPETLATDPADVAEPAGSCERELLRLALDRHRADLARRQASATPTATERDLVRSEQLRAAIDAHESTLAEPLRLALDALRDQLSPVGGAGDVVRSTAVLVERLADLGLDLRAHEAVGPLEAAEVRRVAEDWLDEHQRRGAWVVGARVELAGLERRTCPSASAAGTAEGGARAESAERRSARATEALAAAVARAADRSGHRTAGGELSPGDVEALVRARIDQHRRDRLAGAAPLLLDGVFASVARDALGPLLDRVTEHAGGVQLVLIDDRPEATSWARLTDHRQAELVAPAPGHLR